jgi:hypothetical protein
MAKEDPSDALVELAVFLAGVPPLFLAHFINSLIQPLDDMKPIEDKNRVWAKPLDGINVGLSQVTGSRHDRLSLLLGEDFCEEPINGFTSLSFANPDHTGTFQIVNDGNVLVPSAVGNLVHPDRA